MKPLNTAYKLLTFKLSRDAMLQFKSNHFALGLLGTWIVGMGRYWDDPDANILQHLGLGSVIYIFVLAAIIWVLLIPYKIEHWKYFTVLTFISLTSFPAIFYGFPIEKFVSMSTANTVNVWFLAIVALWRLSLLFYFFKTFTNLKYINIFTVTLLPICLIITTLTLLNLHRVVFDVMAGLRYDNSYDLSYLILNLLTGISVALFIPLLISYIMGIYSVHKR